jgi:hypothetical protein
MGIGLLPEIVIACELRKKQFALNPGHQRHLRSPSLGSAGAAYTQGYLRQLHYERPGRGQCIRCRPGPQLCRRQQRPDRGQPGHATEDARSAAFQVHLDNIDRFSKSFQNYQLDQTELQDNNLNARGAVPNSLADALVKANPDRYQIVPTQDFLKGSDF